MRRPHLSLCDSGEDGSADRAGVVVQPQVVQQQTGGQQHGCGVCRVVFSDVLSCVPSSLHSQRVAL